MRLTGIVRTAFLRQLSKIGWAGILGVALFMFAVAFAYSGNRERQVQLAEIARQRQDLAAQLTREHKPETSPREILEQFKQSLPVPEMLPDILLQLDTRARQYGLAPSRADYSESIVTGNTNDKGSANKFRRVRISMPVKGSYAAVRDWLADVLESVPGLSVDAIEFQRKDMSQTVLDAQIRLAVYMRGQP
ncbi:GspMb/PilO family protein [Uliginosibacterium gangwonense]|uniref:GspMb/PilO family protein n=1 Tax=Uliginosibacterium gangwonense TaxID=392736 RepID=UPI0003A080A2|nr:GspMb/PilO family protein [Uliginosibacterium gangwonense]